MGTKSYLAGLLLSTILACPGQAFADGATVAPAQAAAPPPAPPPATVAAPSDDGAQDIVVTTTRQGATLLQRTPIAVSVVSQQGLDRSFASNIKDLVQFTPSLNVAQVTASAAIYIRGIGTNAVFNGSDPDVAFYVDNVYLARAFTQFSEFLDVDRVEVLRGPQGTLYGRNAVGGVVNLISRLPTDTFEGRAQLVVGTYGHVQAQGYVSGAIVSGVLDASLSGSYTRHDGYTKNIVPGAADLGDADRGAFRGQLRFRGIAGVDAITRFDYSKLAENIQAYDVLLRPLPFPTPLANSLVGQYHRIAQNNPQTNRQEVYGISEEINIDLGGSTKLKSLTAYRHSQYRVTTDTDASELTINNAQQRDLSKQFSQEFNLLGKVSIVDYVLGLYYFREHESSLNEGNLLPSVVTPIANATLNQALPATVATSKAVFAQGTVHLAEPLSLILGLRYTEDEKKLDVTANRFSYATQTTLGPQRPGFPFVASVDPKFHATTPKIGLNWQITPDHFAYASYSRGFKSGGNNFGAVSLLGITYQPEKLTSYEAGIKTQWLDRRLKMNLTGFYYDYKDLQVQSLIGPGITLTANAAAATVKGIEFESTARLGHLDLTGNVSYIDARYKQFASATVPGGFRAFTAGDPRYNAAAGTYNAAGNRLNAAPEVSGSASAQYNVPLHTVNAYGRAELFYQSRVYYDPSNVAISSQAPYALLNLSVGVDSSDGKWSAQVAVKNVTDKGYLITVAGNGAVPSGYAGSPRTAFVRLSRKF